MNDNVQGDVLVKKSHKGLIISIIIIVLLLAIGTSVYLGYKSATNPEKVYEKAIKEGFKELNEKLEEVDENVIEIKDDDTIGIIGNLEVKSTEETFKKYSPLNVKYDLALDAKNKQAVVNTELQQQNKEIVSAIMYLLDNNAYIDSAKLFNKIIKIEDAKFNMNITKPNYTVEEFTKLTEKIQETILESLNKENFKKDKKDIEINDEKVNVNNYIYTLDNSDLKNLIKDIIKVIEKEDKLVSEIAKSNKMDKDEVIDEFKSILDTKKFKDIEEVEFNIYTKGFKNDIVGFTMLINDDETINYTDFKDIVNATIEYEKVKITYNFEDETHKINIKEDKKEIANIKVVEKDDDKYNFEIVRTTNKNRKVTINIELEHNVKNKKELNSKMKIVLNAKTEKKDVNLEINTNNTIKTDVEIKKPDMNKVINIKDFTEEDQKTFMENLQKITEGNILGDLFNSSIRS